MVLRRLWVPSFIFFRFHVITVTSLHFAWYPDGVLVCVTVRGGLSLQDSKDSIAFYFPELQDENGGPMGEGE